MRLIGRMTFGLMGILLALITLVQWGWRSETGISTLLLRWDRQISPNYPSRHEYGIDVTMPGRTSSYALIPPRRSYNFQLLTNLSHDGWLYTWEAEDWIDIDPNGLPVGPIYRMRGDGSQRQRVVEGVVGYSWATSDDKQWLVFQQANNRDFYRVRLDGSSLQDLTANFEGYISYTQWLYAPDITVSPDNHWLWFTAAPSPGTPQNLYRVPFNPQHSQPAEVMLEAQGFYISAIQWPFTSDWLLIRRNDGYYRFNASTRELLPLFNMPPDIELEYSIVLLPEHQLLLAYGVRWDGDTALERYYWGVQLGNAEPLWMVKAPYRDSAFIMPYTQDEIYWQAGDNIHRMRWDGKQGDETILKQAGYDYAALSPDKQWIYFQQSGRYYASVYLYRWRISDGMIEKLHQFQGAGTLGVSPSPNGEWLAVTIVTGDEEFAETEVYLMRPDGSELHQVAHLAGSSGATWGLPVNRSWQPIRLLMLGIGLLLLGLWPRRLTKLPRRTLSSLRGH